MIARQTCEADIFLKRREYKRRIKKHIPKDMLSVILANSLVHELLVKKEDSKVFGGLVSSSNKSLSEKEEVKKENFLADIFVKKVESSLEDENGNKIKS